MTVLLVNAEISIRENHLLRRIWTRVSEDLNILMVSFNYHFITPYQFAEGDRPAAMWNPNGARNAAKNSIGRSLRKEKMRNPVHSLDDLASRNQRPLSIHSTDTTSTEYGGGWSIIRGIRCILAAMHPKSDTKCIPRSSFMRSAGKCNLGSAPFTHNV